MSAPEKRVCVGAVAGAHGVRGAVKIKSFTAAPEDVARYGPLEDESGERQFSLHLIGAGKGVLIGHLSGIADRNQAEAARGLRLYLPRAALPPTEEDEYYTFELVGLDVVEENGRVLGTVTDVIPGVANDVLELDGGVCVTASLRGESSPSRKFCPCGVTLRSSMRGGRFCSRHDTRISSTAEEVARSSFHWK